MSSGPLPSGRHRLSREQVVASQRGRMLAAMAETMMQKGYVGTSVAEIIRRAGVSRETFYQQFRSKQDCFLQGLDTALEIFNQLRMTVPDSGRAPEEVFRDLLRGYLGTLAAQPALARLFLVEVYAAGPEVLEHRRQAQSLFVAAMAEVFGVESEEDRFACEAVVAAVAQLVTAHLVADDIEGLKALEGPMTRLAVRLLT
ncbi:transcriptional regulator [Streptomyces albus]|uniref:Transcriptional regulator n=1 Tax=Streptomyces albus (strain ATCC 21838 / DSM 41398 / FERM P-419 / JCM 4703 / NBRC 107858) TaxID=1081613 RepID=A0A0B5EIC7_STRA4|nr:transcriptional regulator [Streptomyces albus]